MASNKASYHGPGLSIETLSIKESSSDLADENATLREEVAYLRQLLGVWQACPTCQLNPATTNSSKSRLAAAGSRHDAVNRILRQQQVLIAQQQRQLLALQVELSSREQLVLEADAVLAETARRITALAAWASQQQHSTAGQAQQQQPQHTAVGSSRRLVPSSSLGSRPTTAVSTTAGGSKAGAAGVCGVVLEHCSSLLAWCREAEARIARSKAASTAQCRGTTATGSSTAASSAASSRANSRAARSSGGASKQQWQSPDSKHRPASADEVLQQLEVAYLPAGGNAFLQPGATLSLPGIASGQGLLALAAPALQQLLHQLACLVTPLAELAVQLRSIILPALPWVQASSDLPSSCACLAQQSATAAVQLAELCALLPAIQGTLSVPAAAAARQARARQAAAAADAGAWGSLDQQQQQKVQPQPQAQAASQQQPWLDPEDDTLLQEVTGLLSGSQHANKHPPTGTKATLAAGRGVAAGSAQATHVAARLRQRLQVLGMKQRVLNDQLSFLAKCSAATAKLMTRLATDVVTSLSEAVDSAEPPSLQQQRSSVLQLCSQLQRASLLAQQQQQQQQSSAVGWANVSLSSSGRSSSGAGSNTARAVLSLLQNNRDALDNLPQLLTATSASTLKAAGTAAVVAALNDFRAGLQP